MLRPGRAFQTEKPGMKYISTIVAAFALAICSCPAIASENVKSIPDAAKPAAQGPASPVVEPAPSSSEVTLMAVGDIVSNPSWARFDISADKLFKNVTDRLFEASFVIGNLESPIAGGQQPAAKKGPAKQDDAGKGGNAASPSGRDVIAAALRDAGFTLLTLANNHMMDLKEEGLNETISGLKGAGLKYAGAGANLAEASRPAEVDAGGMKVLVIAASDVIQNAGEATGTAPGVRSMKDPQPIINQVKVLRKGDPAALIVMSLHWGAEATYTPNSRQKDIAHRLIDAGADIVIGHHPNRIQGVELYKDKPVFYSLGNFQFDCKAPANESVLAKVVYREGGRVPAGISLMPVLIDNGGIPRILQASEPMYGAIIKRLDGMNRPLGTMMKGEEVLPVEAAGMDEIPEGFELE